MRNPFRRRPNSRTIACDGHWCTPTLCICPTEKPTVFFDGEHDTHFTGSLEDVPDPRDELIKTLQAQLDLATTIVTRQGEALGAARHLMNVLSQVSTDGKPLFILNEAHTDADAAIIRHAIIDLQAKLGGGEAPALCIPERTH